MYIYIYIERECGESSTLLFRPKSAVNILSYTFSYYMCNNVVNVIWSGIKGYSGQHLFTGSK